MIDQPVTAMPTISLPGPERSLLLAARAQYARYIALSDFSMSQVFTPYEQHVQLFVKMLQNTNTGLPVVPGNFINTDNNITDGPINYANVFLPSIDD